MIVKFNVSKEYVARTTDPYYLYRFGYFATDFEITMGSFAFPKDKTFFKRIKKWHE